MNKHFYSHLIQMDSLVEALNKMNISESEKAHLLSLIDSNLHHTILDAILSELSDPDKKKFLHLVGEEEHDKIWEHLNDKVDNIEEKVKTAAEDLKEKLHKDIEEARS